MFVTAAGCGGAGVETPAARQADVNVSVEDFQYSQAQGGERVLSGRFRNDTNTLIRNAQILVSLYDADNRRISTMRIDVKDVPPGDRKAFREPVDSDLNVQGAKVRSVLLL